MKKILIITMLSLAVFCLTGKMTITQSAPGTYHVIWSMPDWKVNSDKDFSNIQAAGLGKPDQTGAPNIPFDECKVSVPQDGSATVNLISQSLTEVKLDKRLQPVAAIVKGTQTDVWQYTIDESLYGSTGRGIINALPVQRFRSLTIVPIRINPFIYDGKYTLQALTRLEFIVTVQGNLLLRSDQPLDELTALVAKQTINPVQATSWQSAERTQVNYTDFNQSDVWVKIETDKDGMFRISPAQLSMLPNNDIDPRTFRMFTTGGETHSDLVSYNGPLFREIPIYISGENDGSFDTNDYILFYGRDRDGLEMNQSLTGNLYFNPYSKNVCYWLTFGGSFSGSPLRITQASSESVWTLTNTTTPVSVRIETETFQRNSIGFEWFMGKFYGSSTADYEYNISLEDVDTAQNQTLSMLLRQEFLSNGSNLWHYVRLNANGNPLLNTGGTVQEWSWYGLSPITITHTGNNFINGNNTIGIHVIRNLTDNMLLDYYQVDYQKKLIKRGKQFTVNIPGTQAGVAARYDFTGNSSNLRIFKTTVNSASYDIVELPFNTVTGGFNFVTSGNTTNQILAVQDADYFAPASIQSVTPVDLAFETSAYDNIIITPPDFLPSAQTLAGFYNQNFHKRSKIVLLQDIFNQFNGGMPDPNAVRLFVKQAVQNYPAPAVTSLTLLGSGTLDWRNFSGVASAKNKIIVYQRVPYTSFPTTSDDYFGMLNTSQYPELAIGRYPAKNQTELDIMLNNLNHYVTEPTPGIWRNSLLFIADDQFNGPTIGEYSHSEQMEETAQLTNPSILIDKIFAIDYEYDEFQNKPQARDDMMAGLNAGKLIWYYIGHGSFDVLGAEDYFNGALDLGRFHNPDHLPLFVAASCDVAQYDNYAFDCLSEKVLMFNNAACIAAIAATRECNGPSNVSLLEQYYKYSLNLRNPVGYSLLNAKIAYSEMSNDEKYNLLGDPLLLITTPERDSTLLVGTSTRDTALNSRETATLTGEFSAPDLTETASIYVYDTSMIKRMPNNSPYTFRGKNLFQGSASVTNSQYTSSFVVPDDVTNGNSGLILAYTWNPLQHKDYVNYLYPLLLSDIAAVVDNQDAPRIDLYLNSTTFVAGDFVSSSPLLIAKISDNNGINLTDSPGHSILMILDQTISTTNVTKYFAYDLDSHTQGTLNYQLSGLSKGNHTIQLIAFDNFNRPSVQSITFSVQQSSSFAVENFLPYPNPMPKSGWFTFTISETADVTIGIYTIRGRKIKTITATASRGYNQIAWDGRDADGDYLANNTYFIKLTAKSLSTNKKVEKTEKLVIYH